MVTFLLVLPFTLGDDFYLDGNGVTVKCESANVDDTGVVAGITYTKRAVGEINTTNANTTCTSGITSMYNLFVNKAFNQDIDSWDTSSVTNMRYVFSYSTFNQDINSWNTSNVINMQGMFSSNNVFNQDISDWDVSNVENMHNMFNSNIVFNQSINSWNTGNTTTMAYMFAGADSFNQDIGSWDTGNVTDMSGMFYYAESFNQDITNWCVTNIGSEPSNFATGTSVLEESNKPIWGTCPEPVTDTCTYSGSGTWNINISDNCTLSTNTDIGENILKITGDNGKLTINSTINANQIHIEPTDFDFDFIIEIISNGMIGIIK